MNAAAGIAAPLPPGSWPGAQGANGLAPWLQQLGRTDSLLGGPSAPAAPALPAPSTTQPWWTGAQTQTDALHAAQTAALRQQQDAAAAAQAQRVQQIQQAPWLSAGGDSSAGDGGNGDGSGDGGDGGSGW